MQVQKLWDDVYRLGGSRWGAVLVADGHGLLIDAPECAPGEGLRQGLAALGVHTVERVLLTEHRRQAVGGLFAWEGPLPPVQATGAEAALLARAGDVWRTNHGKYHRYGCIPDRFAPLDSLRVEGVVADGHVFVWRGFTVTAVVFGARSDGDCAYVVERGGRRVAFCGELAMAGGKLHDTYSLQKALPDMMGYHGYLGGLPAWMDAMDRLLALGPDCLSPAHGPVEPDPVGCVAALRERLLDYAGAYSAISAVHHYFPEPFCRGFTQPLGLEPPRLEAKTAPRPQWLERLGETTSCLLRAPSGRALLIDVGEQAAVEQVLERLADGRITAVDGCWITHCHDDHLNALHALTHQLDCPLWTTEAVAEVTQWPQAWFLPALPNCAALAQVKADGEVWQWEGFTLTALHYPGQTLYHSGLLVARDGQKILLSGDSFAPTGLDDYCADNRNLPGQGRGYRLCVEQLERHGVQWLVNQHQSEMFACDAQWLDALRSGMDRRDRCLAALLPGDAGLSLDSQWLRAYPMEQTVTAGSLLRLCVQVTAHGSHTVAASPRLGWGAELPVQTLETAGLSSGSVRVEGPLPRDGQLRFETRLPEALTGTVQIPFDCWLDGAYLGSFVTATVHIVP